MILTEQLKAERKRRDSGLRDSENSMNLAEQLTQPVFVADNGKQFVYLSGWVAVQEILAIADRIRTQYEVEA